MEIDKRNQTLANRRSKIDNDKQIRSSSTGLSTSKLNSPQSDSASASNNRNNNVRRPPGASGKPKSGDSDKIPSSASTSCANSPSKASQPPSFSCSTAQTSRISSKSSSDTRTSSGHKLAPKEEFAEKARERTFSQETSFSQDSISTSDQRESERSERPYEDSLTGNPTEAVVKARSREDSLRPQGRKGKEVTASDFGIEDQQPHCSAQSTSVTSQSAESKDDLFTTSFIDLKPAFQTHAPFTVKSFFTNSSRFEGAGNLDPNRGCDSGNSSFSYLVEHINRNILSCYICSSKFTEPKVLPCLHSFCSGCLLTYLPSESLTISCPQCGHTSILPQEGISGLQENSFLVDLMAMVDNQEVLDQEIKIDPAPTTSKDEPSDELTTSAVNHSDDPQQTVTPRTRTFSESSGDSDLGLDIDHHQRRKLLVCHKHKGQSLRFYCSNCDTAICLSCTDIEHANHYTERLETAMELERQYLKDHVDVSLNRVPEIKSLLENVQGTLTSLTKKEEQYMDEINDKIDELITVLEQRRSGLLEQVQARAATKREKLESQVKELEDMLSDIYTTSQFVDTALESGTDTQLLLVKKQVGERLSSLPQPSFSRPVHTDHLHLAWSPFQPLKESMSGLGCVESSACIPQISSVAGDGVTKAKVGKQSTVSLITRDCEGNVTSGPSLADITCQIEPLGSIQAATLPKLIHIQVVPVTTGEYDIVYCLPKEGKYKVWIRIYNVDVKDSPFQVSCVPDEERHHYIRTASGSLPRPPGLRNRKSTPARPHSSRSCTSLGSRVGPVEDDLVFSMGSRGRGKGEFANPQGVAVTKTGRIYICDSNNQCVQVFSPTGEFLGRWGSRGRTPGQLQRPTGITILQDGNIAISDYDNKWISIHEPGGKFISKIGGNKFLGPKGITVNNRGELIVVDNKGSMVYILQKSGKIVKKFGTRGSATHQFAGPHYAAVNSLGHIIVSDFHNHSIKIFSGDGDYLFSFGTNGEGNGQFNAPTGVAVDPQDNILVADWGNSRIQIFDQFGSFLSYVNTAGCPLYGPQGIAITPDGHLVVSDTGNHCFKVYKYLQ